MAKHEGWLPPSFPSLYHCPCIKRITNVVVDSVVVVAAANGRPTGLTEILSERSYVLNNGAVYNN